MTAILLLLASAFAAGIVFSGPGRSGLAAASAPEAIAGVPLIVAVSAACLLLGLVALRADWRRIPLAMALAGFGLAGAASARLFEARFPPNHVDHLEAWGLDWSQPLRVEGRLVSGVQPTPYGSQFDLEAARIGPVEGGKASRPAMTVSGRIRLRLDRGADAENLAAAEALDLEYGDRIRAPVRLSRPRVYRNPGNFDYRWWLESIEDVSWLGTIASARQVEKLPPAARPEADWARLALGSPTAGMGRLRQRLLRTIDALFPPWLPQGRDGAVLKAVLLGDRTSLDSDTIESFRKVGLYHLLVIAGLHVGLIAMLIELLLRQAGLGMTARSILTLAFLAGFSLLVEQRAPTLRATVMIAAYLAARVLYRRQPALNAVGLAALALLLARPAWLFESGFQLSFAAAMLIAGLAVPILERTTEPYRRAVWNLSAVDLDAALAPSQIGLRLGLRAAARGLEQRLGWLNRHPAAAEGLVTLPARGAVWTANMVLFSAVLQLGLLLPMASTFHRVSLAGIGLNALAVPVMTVLLAVAIPTVALGALWPAAAAVPAKLPAWLMTGLFALTDLPRLPVWLSYRVASPPDWVAWGAAISLAAAAFSLGWRRWIFWTALAAAAVFTALIALAPFAPRLPKGMLEVTALDCGAGDATWIVLPDQTTMLVGAGGSRSGFIRPGAPRPRWDPGEDIVSAYLWSRGVKKIDVLVAPSVGGGRLRGFDAVITNFRVGELWHPEFPAAAGPSGGGWTALPPALEAVVEEARDRGASVRALSPGTEVALGGSSVQILGAPARASGGDDPVALRISSGAASALLEGDIDEPAERVLAASQGRLASQMLEVARRGPRSLLDPEFLARVAPRVAVVTADRQNRRDLPSPAVLDRLRHASARLARTDLDGAVTVEIKGESIAVRAWGRL